MVLAQSARFGNCVARSNKSKEFSHAPYLLPVNSWFLASTPRFHTSISHTRQIVQNSHRLSKEFYLKTNRTEKTKANYQAFIDVHLVVKVPVSSLGRLKQN